MKNEHFDKEILRRLDILISIMLDSAPTENKSSIASKVHRLKSVGLAPSEIANIIGKPTNYVTALLSMKKKRDNKRKTNDRT